MKGPDNLLEAPVRAAPLPEVRNHTRFPAQYFQMMDAADQVFHVMVARLTYDMRRADDEGHLLLADEQTPLAACDRFHGVINHSSLIEESDFAPFKPKCDVVFAHAAAHAPGGKPSARWPVGVRVGEWQKLLAVTGPRLMERTRGGWKVSEPEAVCEVPIRYEHAWGGTCQWPPGVAEGDTELLVREPHNPIGCGFADRAWLKNSKVADIDAPQIEVFGQPFDAEAARAQDYPVVGLGPIARWWQPRVAKGGTYDKQWRQDRWPRLPANFDFGYWNCVQEDQQIDYPLGGEQVVMIGLHECGDMRFRLPNPDVSVALRLHAGPVLPLPMRLDTLIFDLAAFRLSCVYRLTATADAGVRVFELRNGKKA